METRPPRNRNQQDILSDQALKKIELLTQNFRGTLDNAIKEPVFLQPPKKQIN